MSILSVLDYVGESLRFNSSLEKVLVQRLRDSCKSSLNSGHADTITLKKLRDQYEKATFIQVET